MKTNTKDKVVIGMSGGVDSSVAVLMLKNQGHEVVGLTFIQDETPKSKNAALDAKLVAEKLNIEHHIIDISKAFKDSVINYFIKEYLEGRTPNPCAYCNPNMKFKTLLDFADEQNIKYVATGHYAQINYSKEYDKYVISNAVDASKNQSYFLWGLTQEQMARLIFPLGKLLKTEIREFARENNIITQNKADSQEICFILDDDYRKFLTENVDKPINKNGNFIFRGEKKGTHNGYPFYTVGQRKGLGLSHIEPLYVRSIDAKRNEIHLETKDNIADSNIIAHSVNLISHDCLSPEKEYLVKIRYRDAGTPAKCKLHDNGMLEVNLLTPKNSIALGQSLVIYEGDDMLGGGIIAQVS